MRWLVGSLLIVASAACVTESGRGKSPDEAGGRYALFVLGVAQDGGLPHLGCEKPCCVEARRFGRVRYPACLAVHDRESGKLLLVEATPAIEAQVALLHELTGASQRGRHPVDAVTITHAHIGHYLGLAHLGKEVAATRGVQVWVSPRLAGFLRGHGPWKQLVELGQIELRETAPGGSFEPLEGLTVEAIPVPHRDEFSDTMAFKFRGPNQTVLFVPDVDRWDAVEGLLPRLLDGVDVAYLDATFYDGRELPGRDIRQIPHPPMVDTMERLAERARAAPGSVRFIHLNHSNPAWRDEALRRDLQQRGFAIARRGERVDL